MSAWNLVEQMVNKGLTVSSEEQTEIEAQARELLADNVALRALGQGEPAPDVTLTNARGEDRSLSALLRDSAVVLSFYRGQWCAYCSDQLERLQANLPEFEARGGRLVAVSPQTPDNSLATKEKLGLGYEVLSDAGNQTARAFGIAYQLPEALRGAFERLGLDLPAYNGDDSFELPVPATYVIGQDGVIAFAHVDPDYTQRAEIPRILGALDDAAAKAKVAS